MIFFAMTKSNQPPLPSPPIFVRGRYDNPEELKEVLTKAEEAGGALLYFHGGLSGRNYIEKELGLQLRQSLLSETNLSSGSKPGLHPIFVIYDAGIFDPEKLLDYLKDSTVATVVRWLVGKFGSKSFLKADPETQAAALQEAGRAFLDRNMKSTFNDEQIAELLQNEQALRSLAARLEVNDPDVRKISEKVARLSAMKLATLPGLGALKPAIVALKIATRFALRLNHQFLPTIEEEVLRELSYLGVIDPELFAKHHWKTVYERTEECWQPGKNGSRLIAELAGLRAKAKAAGREFPIHAMSHSAGSIAISHLVEYIAKNDGPKLDSIIMLAPAVRHSLFAETVVKYPEAYTDFRAFILQDARERSDQLVWGAYPASLLYFVSGFCEETGSGDCLLLTDRHLTRQWPYTAWWYPKTIGRQQGDFEAVWKFFAVPGRKVLCPDSSGTDGVDNDGTSHEDTKLLWCTRRLGKAVLFLLTGKKVTDAEIPAPRPPLKSTCPAPNLASGNEKSALALLVPRAQPKARANALPRRKPGKKPERAPARKKAAKRVRRRT